MNQTTRFLQPYSTRCLLWALCLLLFTSAVPLQPESLLRVKQSGAVLHLQFPRLQNRSALKLLDFQGNLVKGVLVDEQLTEYRLPLANYRPGLHQVRLENRQQRFTAKIWLQ
ncbi:MAG: hypothetical protein ACK4E8_06870 [Lacibacter sp.]|jgi:hypothetical protein